MEGGGGSHGGGLDDGANEADANGAVGDGDGEGEGDGDGRAAGVEGVEGFEVDGGAGREA
uniref:Uncharacterized protein n=1 Tax=Arcella intermedia TaxID=1963864 RepID=A0A6B2LUJ2_9EUKA